MLEPDQRCRNCGTPLSGEFCSQCGQREGRGDVHLREVAGELADDVLHWDSRLWRTLGPLLFRPGFLTAEFIAGRKARYVPAFRLYLIISFAMFLSLSLRPASVSIDAQAAGGEPAAESAGETATPGGGQVDGEALDITFDFRPKRPGDIEQARERGETVIAPFAIGGDDSVVVDEKITIGLADEDSPQWLKDLEQRMDDNAQKLAENPADFVDTLLEYLPQTMFLFLPLFAVLVKLCYLFSPFHYLQHLVFSLHLHSFLFLLVLVTSLAEWLLSASFHWLLFLLVPLYLPMALKRTYGSSTLGAIGKSLVIAIANSLLTTFGFALLAMIVLVLM